MEGVMEELSMFVGPLVASTGIVVLVVFVMGLLTLKKWITWILTLFVGTLIFFGAIVYVNSIQPDEITSDLFRPDRFFIWIFQQIGKAFIPGMNKIEEFIHGN